MMVSSLLGRGAQPDGADSLQDGPPNLMEWTDSKMVLNPGTYHDTCVHIYILDLCSQVNMFIASNYPPHSQDEMFWARYSIYSLVPRPDLWHTQKNRV